MEDTEKKWQMEITVKGINGKGDVEKFANKLIKAYHTIPNRQGLTMTYVGRVED